MIEQVLPFEGARDREGDIRGAVGERDIRPQQLAQLGRGVDQGHQAQSQNW